MCNIQTYLERGRKGALITTGFIFSRTTVFFGNYSSFPGRGTITCPGLGQRVRAEGPCPDSGDLLSITKIVILETYARNAGKCIA